ncbi:MAG: threonine synthase [Armatimonadetes bacterium]|nr:threonine synthase [Armatimonadota bacterium]
MAWQGIVDEYRSRLELSPGAKAVSLLEGRTPLVPLPRLARSLGEGVELYAKFEGLNPSGSFKDRGMTVAVTQAVHDGAQAVVCASTGNTAASAAAYAARAGIKCVVVVPEGKVALGKLAGAIAYGAQVVQIRGSFDDALLMVREASQRSALCLVNSVNPSRIEGQKTAAFEVVDDLGDAPDFLCLPVGNAGNTTAYWKGFSDELQTGRTTKRPVVVGVQAAGSAPMVLGHPVTDPQTVATAIRIGNPARWNEAATAFRESGGHVRAVSDDAILAMARALAQEEGVFCEPSSATGLAGFAKAVAEGAIDPRGKRVVAVVTGHGMKDPDNAMAGRPAPVTIDATTDALLREVER